MTVIRHWIVYDLTASTWSHVVERDESKLDDHRTKGYTVEGP